MIKHKHYDLILAWASGSKIEVKGHQIDGWYVVPYPQWDSDREFRIKPEREYPKTSLILNDLLPILVKHKGSNVALLEVADLAVKRYIDDQENKE